MVELEGIEIPIIIDASQMRSGLNEAQRAIENFGNSARSTAGTVQDAGGRMRESLAEPAAGLDQAERSVEDFGSTTADTASKVATSGDSMTQTYKETADAVANASSRTSEMASRAEDASGRIVTANDRMGGSYKNVALGMSQTMTSAFSLYQSIDNIEKKQYALEKANLAAQRSTEAVDQAQKDYNEAVEKFGTDSVEAKDALDKLNLSKDAAELADERVKISQNNVNDSMTMAALTVIPAVISGFDGLTRTWKSFSGLDPGGLIGKIKDAFSALGSDKIGILAGVGFGIGSLYTTFKMLNATTKEEKELYTGLAMVMNAATVAMWALNAAKAFGVALTPVVGLAIVAAAGVAAATTYALSSMYGAKTEAPSGVPTAPGAGGTVGGVGGGGAGWTATPGRAITQAESLKAGELTLQGLKPGTQAWYQAGGPGLGFQEMPTVTPGAGMTPEQMAGAGLGEYTRQTGLFVPNEEMLIRDDIAFKISAGANKGKYKWTRQGPAEEKYFTMEDLKRIQRGDYVEDYERDLRPWFTYGFEERADELGNVWLQGKHFQKGGLVLGDTLGLIERDEAVLPLTNPRAMGAIATALRVGERSVIDMEIPRAMQAISAAIGGGTTNNYITFNIDGSRDVDLVMNEIARKLWGRL